MLTWLLSSIVKAVATVVKIYASEVIKPIAIEYATKTAFTVLRMGF